MPPAPQLRLVTEEESRADSALRPTSFDDYCGQKPIIDKMRIYCGAVRQRGEVLDHTLLIGPPGLGKTSLAQLLASELGVKCQLTSGPMLDRKADLAGILANLQRGQILFVDEIHRVPLAVTELLYLSMEDFRLDVMLEGPGARTIQLPLERHTLIGATTEPSLLSQPLRDRFSIVERLQFYSAKELAQITTRSAGLLGIQIDSPGAYEIGKRARGTPRIANRLLRRIRDFAQMGGDSRITKEIAGKALDTLGIDSQGLDETDRAILQVICDSECAGLETIAATVGESVGTISSVYEPYLLQQKFILKTGRGRTLTEKARRALAKN